MTASITSPRPDRSLLLPLEPASARAARRHVAKALAGMNDELVEAATLLTSELVTNALLHAEGDIQLRVHGDADRVRVEVRDASTTPPVMRHRNLDAESGRGVQIVEQAASAWGVDIDDRGKTVWFELSALETAMDDDAASTFADLFPRVLHDAPAAILLVDLDRQEVVYANANARELVTMGLPADIDAWSREAGLQEPGGRALDETSSPLSRIAQGIPISGEPVTVARRDDRSRRPLWVVGFPLQGVPAVHGQALVVFFELAGSPDLGELGPNADEALKSLRDRAVLATDISFTISDPHQADNPLVWVNPAFTRVTGYSAEEVIGRNCRFLQGQGTDPEDLEKVRGAIDQRRPVTVTLLNYRRDGTAFWNELALSPVFDGDGALTHFVGVQADVTHRVEVEREREAALASERKARAEAEAAVHEAERARRQVALLAEVSEALAGSLDVDHVLDRLLDVVTGTVADWCAVDLEDHEGALRRVVSGGDAVSAGASSVEGPIADALHRGEPLRMPRLSASALGRVLGRPQPPAAAPEGGCVMVVPMRARSRVLGVMTFVRHLGDDAEPFTDADLRFALDLAGRAALSLDNARLYTREHQVAETLQRSLLPELPVLEGLEVAARYVASTHGADVGGDWYDVFPVPGDGIAVGIGDVMGHDMHAAAAMGQLRSILRGFTFDQPSPARVLDRLDRLLDGVGAPQLATVVLGRLARDEEGVRLTWADAGHLPPLLVDPGGDTRFLEDAKGLLLGAPLVEEREEAQTVLPVGATLVLYTDGLVERRGVDLDDGLERLRQAADELPAEVGVEALCDRLLSVLGDERSDDVAVLALRVR